MTIARRLSESQVAFDDGTDAVGDLRIESFDSIWRDIRGKLTGELRIEMSYSGPIIRDAKPWEPSSFFLITPRFYF